MSKVKAYVSSVPSVDNDWEIERGSDVSGANCPIRPVVKIVAF